MGLTAQCFEQEDVGGDSRGDEEKEDFEPEGRYEADGNDDGEPEGCDGGELRAHRYGAMDDVVADIRTKAGMAEKPGTPAGVGFEEKPRGEEEEGCGGEHRQEDADNAESDAEEA